MDRRRFLTVSAASASLLAAVPRAGAVTVSMTAAAKQDRAAFVSWLGTQFLVMGPGAIRPVPATLIDVKDGPLHAGLEQFNATFRGESALPCGLCTLFHADGASFSLHLEPVRAVESCELRRATFSLLTERVHA